MWEKCKGLLMKGTSGNEWSKSTEPKEVVFHVFIINQYAIYIYILTHLFIPHTFGIKTTRQRQSVDLCILHCRQYSVGGGGGGVRGEEEGKKGRFLVWLNCCVKPCWMRSLSLKCLIIFRILQASCSYFPFGLDGVGFMRQSLQELGVRHLLLDAGSFEVNYCDLSLCHLCCTGRVPAFPLDLMSENVRFCELFVVIFTTLHTIMVQSTDLKMQQKVSFSPVLYAYSYPSLFESVQFTI